MLGKLAAKEIAVVEVVTGEMALHQLDIPLFLFCMEGPLKFRGKSLQV